MMKEKFVSELKILWKPFIAVFLICFLIINWNSISWIFNYKVIFQFFSGFFQKIFIQPFASTKVEIVKIEDIKTEEKKAKESVFSEEENNLEIPKLKISAPLILIEKESQAKTALDRGVVLYPGSVLPGEAGQTIILGHSAPVNWPKIKYDWVFSRISELEENDEIILYFNQRKFSYYVKDKFFLEKGEDLPKDLTGSKNILILISCWPPGKDLRRIAVVAE